MEKEFVPYEQALALKELGFNEPCAACYGSYTHKTSNLFLNINNPVNIGTLVREKTGFNRPTFYVKTPTFSQAFRWLLILVNKNKHFSNKWTISYNEDYYSLFLGGCNMEVFKGELECLKKLIEIVKEK